jgi:hypothetical protein
MYIYVYLSRCICIYAYDCPRELEVAARELAAVKANGAAGMAQILRVWDLQDVWAANAAHASTAYTGLVQS